MKTNIRKLISTLCLLTTLAAQTASGFYDPNLQRWLTPDPIGEAGGINLYQFVGNDPVNDVDPFGLQNFVVRPGFRQSSRPSTWTRSFNQRGELAREEIREWVKWERDMSPVERVIYEQSRDQYWRARLGRPIRPGETFISSASTECTVYHARTSPQITQSVLDKIDVTRFNPNARFGPGFYVAEVGRTAVAEINFHGGAATHLIRYNFNFSGRRVLDFTDLETARAWGYAGGNDYSITQAIGAKARAGGFDAIKFPSLRGSGDNYVIFGDIGKMLSPQMVSPAR